MSRRDHLVSYVTVNTTKALFEWLAATVFLSNFLNPTSCLYEINNMSREICCKWLFFFSSWHLLALELQLAFMLGATEVELIRDRAMNTAVWEMLAAHTYTLKQSKLWKVNITSPKNRAKLSNCTSHPQAEAGSRSLSTPSVQARSYLPRGTRQSCCMRVGTGHSRSC